MLNNSFPNDPKSIWQNQPTEPFKMTERMIRRKTQQLHRKTRRELLNSIVVSVFVVGLSIFGIMRVHGAAMRGIFVLTIGWTLAAQYFVYRGSLADSKQSDVSLNTSLRSYRREVERQRSLSSSFLVWSFGPIMLAGGSMSALLLAVVRPHGFLPNTIPFFTLLGSWFIVFVIRMQEQRDLQREIDELNEIERSNNS
jgi:Flp pilus assembly protein TadB